MRDKTFGSLHAVVKIHSADQGLKCIAVDAFAVVAFKVGNDKIWYAKYVCHIVEVVS